MCIRDSPACEDGGKGIRPPVLERVQSPDVGVFDRRFNHEQVVIAELAQALWHVGELVDQLGARRRVPMGKVRDLSKVGIAFKRREKKPHGLLGRVAPYHVIDLGVLEELPVEKARRVTTHHDRYGGMRLFAYPCDLERAVAVDEPVEAYPENAGFQARDDLFHDKGLSL